MMEKFASPPDNPKYFCPTFHDSIQCGFSSGAIERFVESRVRRCQEEEAVDPNEDLTEAFNWIIIGAIVTFSEINPFISHEGMTNCCHDATTMRVENMQARHEMLKSPYSFIKRNSIFRDFSSA